LKLPGLDLASLATQGVGAGAQPNAYTGYGITVLPAKGNKSRNETKCNDGEQRGVFRHCAALHSGFYYGLSRE